MDTCKIETLSRLFSENPGATVLTGAGISTESGIPDFRSPETGLYNRIAPMQYLSVDALDLHPERFWTLFAEHMAPIADAEPNAGHRALARLEAAGYVSTVATQNIDGLHTKAGSKNVIEVHGHLRTVRCTACTASYPLRESIAQLPASPVPLCRSCGAMLRPDVVLFGDMLPAFDEALAVVEANPLLLVVGSSLAVHPANRLPHAARHLAIVNREPTMFDRLAQVVIRDGAGEVLESVVKTLGL